MPKAVGERGRRQSCTGRITSGLSHTDGMGHVYSWVPQPKEEKEEERLRGSFKKITGFVTLISAVTTPICKKLLISGLTSIL